MRRVARRAAATTLLAATGAGTYVGLVTGRLTIDLGVGRRTRPLGPLTVDIAASTEVAYAAAAAPYAERRPARWPRRSTSSSAPTRWSWPRTGPPSAAG